jgi:hypothetical protein
MCAEAALCASYVAPRIETANTDSGSTTWTNEAAPWYNQPAVQGKGEDEVSQVSLLQRDNYVDNAPRDTAALLTEGLTDHLGTEGSIAYASEREENGTPSPPPYEQDPRAVQSGGRDILLVDLRDNC